MKIKKAWVSWEELRAILTGGELESITHTHDDEYYTETELDAGQLDNRYYTEAEIVAILAAYGSKTTAAWNKSIGSGGDYSTWSDMIDDMPDLLAHAVTVTIKKGTTLTEICDIRNKHGIMSAGLITVQAERYYPTSGVLPTGDSATATTLRDAALAAEAFGNDYFNGCWIFIVDGTGTDNGFVLITDYVDATGDVVVAAWPGTQPDNTSRYLIVGAMIDCGGTIDNGFYIQGNTVDVEIMGIGIDDADTYGIYVYRSQNNNTISYCGVYGSDYDGAYIRGSRTTTLKYMGIVGNNTDNYAGAAGVSFGSRSFGTIYLSGISDNLQRGIYASTGAFANYITNNFGDNNGNWGLWADTSAQARLSGIECSGAAGNHSDPGTAGNANADQAAAY